MLPAGGSACGDSARPEDDTSSMHDDESDSCLPEMADQDPEPVQHVHVAVEKEWAFRRAPILDEEVEHLIQQIVHEPDKLMEKRAAALHYWTARAQKLDRGRASMQESLPDHLQSTTGRLHVTLLRELLEAAHHYDLVIEHLTHGFTVIGEMTGGGQGKAPPGGVPRAGKQAHGRVPDLQIFSRPGPHAEELWRKTVQEVHKCHFRNIRTLDEVDLDSILVTAEQVNAEGITKVPGDGTGSQTANLQLHSLH